MTDHATTPAPDKRHAAVCGLFCPACMQFIATAEDPEKLRELSERYGRPVEEMRCRGCRSDTLFIFCKESCFMKGCAEAKGHDFCGECADYPCAELKDFQAKRPHRIELWRAQERIREAGYEQWYAEMAEHFSCPECGTINSAYHPSCRKCGATPSCAYVREHGKALADHAARESGT